MRRFSLQSVLVAVTLGLNVILIGAVVTMAVSEEAAEAIAERLHLVSEDEARAAAADLATLDEQVTDAESGLEALASSDVGSQIADLDGRMSEVEGAVDDLDGRVSDVENESNPSASGHLAIR